MRAIETGGKIKRERKIERVWVRAKRVRYK